MPKLLGKSDIETGNTMSGFQYSSIGIKNLGASQYTIVQILMDWTGSVGSFAPLLEQCLKDVFEACSKGAMSENILFRVLTFSDQMPKNHTEIHGFLPLNTIDPQLYNIPNAPYGGTPLYNVTLNAVESLFAYGKELHANRYTINSVLFVVTDGEDTQHYTAQDKARAMNLIANLKAELRNGEFLDTFNSYLIGINDTSCQKALKDFERSSCFDGYKSIQDANSKSIAKLAQWMSQSVSTVSKNIGGGNSQQIVQQINNFSL
jgi:uncharacterized protein YegL